MLRKLYAFVFSREAVVQFVKFCLVGFTNLAVHSVVYFSVMEIVRVNYIAANVLATIIGICNSYYWNSRAVFVGTKQGEHFATFAKMCVAYGIAGGVGTTAIYACVTWLGMSAYYGPIINAIVCTPFSFVLNRFWVFGRRP